MEIVPIEKNNTSFIPRGRGGKILKKEKNKREKCDKKEGKRKWLAGRSRSFLYRDWFMVNDLHPPAPGLHLYSRLPTASNIADFVLFVDPDPAKNLNAEERFVFHYSVVCFNFFFFKAEPIPRYAHRSRIRPDREAGVYILVQKRYLFPPPF
jgi:hypothetical protein